MVIYSSAVICFLLKLFLIDFEFIIRARQYDSSSNKLLKIKVIIK